MTEQTVGSSVSKGLGGLIGGAIGGLLTWLNTGSSGLGPGLIVTAAVLCAIGGVAFSHIYRRYLGVLAAGGARAGSPSRHTYDALRKSLSEGNIAARLYASRLAAFLDKVDRFFGDDRNSYTLFARAFGLKTPAPLWTASAFERCLFIAFVYPIASIALIWAISGHVGLAEKALNLEPHLSTARRGLALILAFGPSSLAFFMATRTSEWKSLLWLFIGCTALSIGVIVDIFFVHTGSGIWVFGFVFVIFIVRTWIIIALPDYSTNFSVAIVVFSISAFIVGAARPMSSLVYTAVILHVISLCIAVTFLHRRAIERGMHGAFLTIFLFVMITACLAATTFGARPMWGGYYGPALLFFGLFTLINAPFDWASLGLTRALLRRGLELGGWWPYFLAVVDAAVAAVIIASLAIAMVVGVQAFDGLVVRSGGTPILPLDPFFNGIAAHPTAPEYWWVYALLLSTMIPSLINLIIGGASLLRGIPGLPQFLLGFMPPGKAVPAFDRHWMALLLTAQIFVGATLGVILQAVLAYVIIVYIMPPFGLGLLDMAREVAAFNLPLRIGQLFTRLF